MSAFYPRPNRLSYGMYRVGDRGTRARCGYFKIYGEGSEDAPAGCVWFYYRVWMYFTPRSVCIVCSGDVDDGWMGPWFGGSCGRRDPWSGVGCGHGGLEWGGGGLGAAIGPRVLAWGASLGWSMVGVWAVCGGL